MKFWKRLRWIASIVFIAMLLLGWLGTALHSNQKSDSTTGLRAAPIFNH